VRRLGLADALERAGHVLHREHTADLARLEPPVQVRMALEELGPTFVKLGQILAGRADLFGPEWIAEFAKLHSRVPAVPPDALRPQLREDLGGEPEEPCSRASTPSRWPARHRAGAPRALKDGTEVVVKIRRPGIARPSRPTCACSTAWPRRRDRLPALAPYRPAAAGARVRALAAARAGPGHRVPQRRTHRRQPRPAALHRRPARALGLHRRAPQRAGRRGRHGPATNWRGSTPRASTARCWRAAARRRC
jgi:hypothetical protein